MSGQDIVITIVSVALIVGATTALALFLKFKTDTRKEELASEGQGRLFDAFERLTEQDTRRQELLLEAQKRVNDGQIEEAWCDREPREEGC